MKPELTTLTTTMVEWHKTWWSMMAGWAEPAPAVDKARQAEQAAADKDWEGEGGSVHQPKKPAGETPAIKLPL